MKLKKAIAILVPCVALLLAACNRDIDEFKFTGVIVGAEMCSSTQIGYLIDVLSPDSIGTTATVGNKKYEHILLGYRASRILYQGDTINAVGYYSKGYAAINCLNNISNDLPEVILLSVDE